jgi:predicted GTPase
MTQDEITEMARKAGCIPRRHPEYWEDVQVFATPDVLVAFAKLVDAKATAKEREACEKEVENALYGQEGCGKAVKAIRARGEA